MNQYTTKVKNPCKICLNQVTHKNGLQCMGACKKWAHFKCLNYTPGRISDIKAGIIKVTCPCPNCDTQEPKEYLTSPPYACSNQQCPVNKPVKCSSDDCPLAVSLKASSSSTECPPSCPIVENPESPKSHCPPQLPPLISPKKPSQPCPQPPTPPKCPPPPSPPKCPPPPLKRSPQSISQCPSDCPSVDSFTSRRLPPLRSSSPPLNLPPRSPSPPASRPMSCPSPTCQNRQKSLAKYQSPGNVPPGNRQYPSGNRQASGVRQCPPIRPQSGDRCPANQRSQQRDQKPCSVKSKPPQATYDVSSPVKSPSCSFHADTADNPKYVQRMESVSDSQVNRNKYDPMIFTLEDMCNTMTRLTTQMKELMAKIVTM